MNDSWSQRVGDSERWERLTEKQRACLDLLLERRTSKQIARELGISKDTVDQRIAAARRILGSPDRNAAALDYGRLKAIYDRVVYDPAVLAQPPRLVPSDFPDGDPAPVAALSGKETGSDGAASPHMSSGDIWSHDHGLKRRIFLMAAMLVVAVILIFAGLAIGQSLTRLISG